MVKTTADASAWSGDSHGDMRVLRSVLRDAGDDPFRTWVANGAGDLIAALRDTLLRPSQEEPQKVAVVLVAPSSDDPWTAAAAEAACEAARGVVGALTLERGPAVRLNLILASDAETPEMAETLDLLASPEGSFVAGATFDLREDR
jgi:hypothetical protein